jgi:hypothetical protein
MNNQQENLIDSELSNTDGKRPRSLNVLLILSSIYIVMSFSATLQSLSDGPRTEVQMETDTAEFYSSIVELKDQGIGEGLTDMAEVMIESSFYINNEAFYLTNNLRLLELIIGAISIVLMFQLKKTGFHVYLFYSLFPIITTYITLPQKFILTASIVLMLIFAALFAFLYGSKLKYMK